LRIATYNTSLYGKVAGQIRDRLSDGKDSQAEKIAAIVQTVRPDILLVNEIDYDSDAGTAKLLAEKFFAKAQGELKAIDYPFIYAAPSNTGIDSEFDLNNNGKKREPNDAWGFGAYPGQYSMAVYSRYPIDEQAIRTFQNYRWSELPKALRPVDPDSDDSYYDEETWKSLRLSSKNHIDVPIVINQRTIHVLASHPTPPVFDGPEDRNGCRNHDEIRFWVDYLAGKDSKHLIDDQDRPGGVAIDASVVVMGDLNSDPADGDGRQQAIKSLLSHQRLQDPRPTSKGGAERKADGKGGPDYDTARFRHGNMRIDYVLPSRDLKILNQGVFWPTENSDDFRLISASDHRMVWIEVELP
jgi:endonuclease/exonuclease/phosphatase family metal-dependent hydrolase